MRRVALAILVALAPWVARAAPTVVGVGSSTIVGSTGTCIPQTSSVTWQDGDLLVVFARSENEAISLSTANSFTEIGTQASQAAGTAATDPATRLAVFYKIANGGGADSMPVVGDSGNNTECQLIVFRGADTTDPFDLVASGNDGGASDQDIDVPGGTTTVDDTLVVAITSFSRNGTSTANCTFTDNTSLTSFTEQFDSANTAGLGGGVCIATGVRATAGTVSATTGTLGYATNSYEGALVLALIPLAGQTYNDSFTDAITLSDTLSNTQDFVDALTEAITLTDSLSDQYIPGGTTYNDSTTEGLGGSSPISVETTVTGNVQNTTSVSTSALTTAGPSVLVAAIQANATGNWASDVSSVTGGTNLTTGWTKAAGGGAVWGEDVEIWYAVTGSAQSSQTITATWANTVDQLSIAVLSLTGVDTTTPIDATLDRLSQSTNMSRTITVATSGALVIGSVYNGSIYQVTPSPSSGAEWAYLTAAENGGTLRSSSTVSAGDFTIGTSGWNTGFAISTVVAIKPAGGGGLTDSLVDELIPGGGGTTYNDPIAEAASGTDTLSTVATMAGAASEAASSVDALAAANTLAGLVGEASGAGDSLAGAATWAGALSEAGAASEALASAATFPASFADAAAAAESLADQHVPGGGGPQVYNEAVADATSALDSLASAATMLSAFADAAAAADALSPSLSIARTLAEAAGATDATSGARVLVAALSEAAVAEALPAPAAVLLAALGDAAGATDALATSASLAAALSEATALDALVAALGAADLAQAPTLLLRMMRPVFPAPTVRPELDVTTRRPIIRVRRSP